VVPGRVGAALTKPGRVSTARWCGSGERDGEEYERNRRRYVPFAYTGSKPGGSGPEAVRTRGAMVMAGGELSGWSALAVRRGCEEGLRRTHSDAAGTESGSSFIERIGSEHGNRLGPHPRVAHPARVGGWAHRPLIGPGRGGAAVVLRAGESSCTWGRAAAGSRRDCGGCNAARDTIERWRVAGAGPGWSASAGSGDAGQASSLGGGRSWPQVR
jgi:hypothetical protein